MPKNAIIYGWYSQKDEQVNGASLWETMDGKSVKVTKVSHTPNYRPRGATFVGQLKRMIENARDVEPRAREPTVLNATSQGGPARVDIPRRKEVAAPKKAPTVSRAAALAKQRREMRGSASTTSVASPASVVSTASPASDPPTKRPARSAPPKRSAVPKRKTAAAKAAEARRKEEVAGDSIEAADEATEPAVELNETSDQENIEDLDLLIGSLDFP